MSDSTTHILANIILKEENGDWEPKEPRTFAVLPRVGDHISIDPDGRIVVEVVMVVHPSDPGKPVALHVVDLGSLPDALGRLEQANRQRSLSMTEREVLYNQYYALSKLFPAEADGYLQQCEILSKGYTQFYAVENIHPDEVSEQESCLVENIMVMFQQLIAGYKKLTDKLGINSYDVCFQGFDGNSEGKLMTLVQFMVHRQRRFSDLIEGTRDDFNSHAPRLERYRKMLAEWHRTANKLDISKEDIVRIIGSHRH